MKRLYSKIALTAFLAASAGLQPSLEEGVLALGPRAALAAPVDIPTNTWVRRKGPTYPAGPQGANKHIKMAYNAQDRKVYLIGGDYNVAGITNGASFEMIYSYDVATDTWRNVLNYANSGTAGYPEGRCAPGWAYDSKRNVFWFGMGQTRQAGGRPGLVKGGLWTFDSTLPQDSGQVWKREAPDVPNAFSATSSANLPPNSYGEVWYMQYDPATDALYVPYSAGGKYLARYDLNGLNIRNGVSKDIWRYTSLSTPPYFLGMLSFALDTKRGKFVFYFPWPGPYPNGTPGTNRGETWEYATTTNTWTKLSDTVLPAKCCFGMVYDSANDKIVLFAGYDGHEGGITNPLNDVWTFDRNPASVNFQKWTKLTPAGTPPTPRKGETMAYDSYNNVIVQFGGRGWDSQPDASDVYLLRLGSGTADVEPPPVPRNLRAQ